MPCPDLGGLWQVEQPAYRREEVAGVAAGEVAPCGPDIVVEEGIARKNVCYWKCWSV